MLDDKKKSKKAGGNGKNEDKDQGREKSDYYDNNLDNINDKTINGKIW